MKKQTCKVTAELEGLIDKALSFAKRSEFRSCESYVEQAGGILNDCSEIDRQSESFRQVMRKYRSLQLALAAEMQKVTLQIKKLKGCQKLMNIYNKNKTGVDLVEI